MIHQSLGRITDTPADSHKQRSIYQEQAFAAIVAEHTEQFLGKTLEDSKRNLYMNPEDSTKYKLFDNVITHNKKVG